MLNPTSIKTAQHNPYLVSTVTSKVTNNGRLSGNMVDNLGFLPCHAVLKSKLELYKKNPKHSIFLLKM